MKKLVLISLLFIAVGGQAQTTKPIDSFLGIKFGSSPAQVIEALKAKGGTVNAGQTAQYIGFSNLTLGNRKVSTLYVDFVNAQAFQAQFVFKVEPEAKSIEYYKALSKDITEVYGEGKFIKKFTPPYVEGDGYEITAFKSGNADYETDWIDGANYIMEVIDNDEKEKSLTVRLYYADGKLRKIFTDQQKAKNKSEF